MARAFVIGAVAAPFMLVCLAFGLAYWWVLAWAIVAVVAVGIVMGIGDVVTQKAVMADAERLRVAAQLSGLWTERTAPAPPVLPPAAGDNRPFTDARVDLARHRSLRARFDGWRYRSPVAGAGAPPTPSRSAHAESPPP